MDDYPSFNSGRNDRNLELIIFKFISSIDVLSISDEIVLRWISQDLTGD